MTIDIVEEMRVLEVDHEPDGWPAVRMRQISALCDEVERLRTENTELRRGEFICLRCGLRKDSEHDHHSNHSSTRFN